MLLLLLLLLLLPHIKKDTDGSAGRARARFLALRVGPIVWVIRFFRTVLYIKKHFGFKLFGPDSNPSLWVIHNSRGGGGGGDGRFATPLLPFPPSPLKKSKGCRISYSEREKKIRVATFGRLAKKKCARASWRTLTDTSPRRGLGRTTTTIPRPPCSRKSGSFLFRSLCNNHADVL